MTENSQTSTIDLQALQAAVGHRVIERLDTLSRATAEAFRSSFWPEDQPLGLLESLPWGLHCLYFLPRLAKSELREDGTPQDNGLVPPVPLPRRMFASEEVEFHRPLVIGETIAQLSKLESIRQREGSSGPLVFATVRHDVGDALTCWQHTVFRGNADKISRESPAPKDLEVPQWSVKRTMDAVDLFRFSALTYNSHRIHYDLDWARRVEGYPQLVVHGQLVSLLLLGAGLRHLQGSPSKYRMRAQAPVFCGDEIELCGRQTGDSVRLWAVSRGIEVMQAELEIFVGEES